MRHVIIDTQTRKRINEVDPLKKIEMENLENLKNSPMDPPDAYSVKNDNITGVLHPLVHRLTVEGEIINQQIADFENNCNELWKKSQIGSQELSETFGVFFRFYDQYLLVSFQNKVRYLYPVIHEKLLDSGEHSKEEYPKTAIDLFEDDYIKTIQLGSLIFNFLGLRNHLKDPVTQNIITDSAFRSAKELIEILKLHFFRESNVLVEMISKMFSSDELDAIYLRLNKAEPPSM